MSDRPDTDAFDVETASAAVERVESEIGERIVGQETVVRQLLVCLLTGGNALVEGIPGLGKTLLIRTLAEAIDLSFARIQNTPDLMPSDITGTEVLRESGDDRVFVFEEGPVFANVVLADEINRATPKTQAALLEAMAEGQVTAGGETRSLPEPFFVLATQNPIDQEGTYPLPEAQRDRFEMKITITPPSFDEELAIVDRYTGTIDPAPPVETVLTGDELRAIQALVRQVPIADDIRERAVRLVADTRTADRLEYGASPRASMARVVGAKAHALVDGRPYVGEADLEAIARPALRHRVVVDLPAQRDGVTPDPVIVDLV